MAGQKNITVIIIVLLMLGGGLFLWKSTQKDTPETSDLPQQPTNTPSDTPPASSTEPPDPTQNLEPLNEDAIISVEYNEITYSIASSEISGSFNSGQEADLMLSGLGFTDAGGGQLFNHPGGLATDGTRLILSDTWNNRVLIWNTAPDASTPPDLVLGQPDFYSNIAGSELDQLRWPKAVATDGEVLVVGDTYNDRILIWTSFPTENGQPADLVLEGFDKMNLHQCISWPWGVWTDGTKLVVSCTREWMVLIWNSFPTVDCQPCDIVLTGDFGTPRDITSNGEYLMIGDHNPRVAGYSEGTFVWTSFPESDDEAHDYLYDGWMRGYFTETGGLVLGGTGIKIWDTIPTSSNTQPDRNIIRLGSDKSFIHLGDYGGIVEACGRVYICMGNKNLVVVYESLSDVGEEPSFVLGAPSLYTNTLIENGYISNPVPASDGTRLLISSDFDQMLHVWTQIPDETAARADIVYTLGFAPWDNALNNDRFAMAGKDTVCIWETLPLNGELPDRVFKGGIGEVSFNEIKGVAMDDQYFYVADSGAGKIYVWEGLPVEDSDPVYILDAEMVTRLSSDGEYLAAALTESSGFDGVPYAYIYNVNDLSSEPVQLISEYVSLPQSVTVNQNMLLVADTGNNRLQVWESIQDALDGGLPSFVLGQSGLDSNTAGLGADSLFMPGVSCFDGSYIWVGEFKFSGRVLRYSPE